MAGYNPYVDINKLKVSKLSFPLSACNYVYDSQRNGKQHGILYRTDESSYNKIKNILVGEPDVKIVKGDKVFVLPGHPLPQVRLKEYLKTIGATLSKNIDKATVIAGSTDFKETINVGQVQPKLASLMFKAREFYEVHTYDEHTIEDLFRRLESDEFHDDYNAGVACVMPREIYWTTGHHENIMVTREQYFMTPNAVNIIYNILARGLKVVTQEVISDAANSGLKLEDPATYESIYQMLKSTDPDSKSLGVNILTHCDLSGDSLYHTWKLAQEFKHVIRNAGYSKGLYYFKDRTHWDYLSNCSVDEFLLHAKEKSLLKASFAQKLLPEVYTDMLEKSPVIADQFKKDWNNGNEFFDVVENGDMSYTIKMKDEWKELLKTKEDE